MLSDNEGRSPFCGGVGGTGVAPLAGVQQVKLERVSEDSGVLRLRARDRVIRGDPSPDLGEISNLLLDEGYRRNVLLSLEETEFVDSSGLSWLLECHQKFCNAGGRLILHSVPPAVMDTLKMMRLELVLHLADDESDALKVVRGENP